MNIRKLELKDVKEYRQLRLKALKNHPEFFSTSYEEVKDDSINRYELKLSNKNAFIYGAFIDNKLVGMVALRLEDEIKLNHRADIGSMYVSEENRRKGIARLLMRHAIEKAKQINKLERVDLTVTSINPAKYLYTSLGFETYGIDKKALKVNGKYYDEEFMVLEI